MDEARLEDEIEEADAFRQGIHATCITIEERRAQAAINPAPTARPLGGGELSASERPSCSTKPQVKLPARLNIQPFDGVITNWVTFWDSYIHKNTELLDIDKFNYLKSLLTNCAIRGLALTSVNYSEAIALLHKCFGNKQKIIDQHMEALLNLEAVQSIHNVKALRRLYDVIETHIRGLRTLGIDSDSYGSLLSSLLLNKIPAEMRLLISRGTESEGWS